MMMTLLRVLTAPLPPSILQLPEVNYDAQLHRSLHVTTDLA